MLFDQKRTFYLYIYEFTLGRLVIANPGSGSPGPPGAPIRGRGWGRGIVLPKNPGPGDFCFQNPGVFGGFFKRFLSEKWEIRGKLFTFSTKKLLENSNLT